MRLIQRSLITSSIILAGCQNLTDSMESSLYTPQLTKHISQSVYAIEFGYAQHFANSTIQLEQSVEHYCSTNRTQTTDQIKYDWHLAMRSWMTLQGQERGPEGALEQSWNVQFWPDKKNTTGRKMLNLITQDTIWTEQSISTQSVTVQGLGAIEWLLYDKASDFTSNANTCSTASAIASNLRSKAQQVALAWQQNPWTSFSTKEWQAEYLSLLSNQLEYSLKKLERPMAKIGQPRPYFSESWRSQTSLSNLKVNVTALEALYLANGKGLDDLLREKGAVSLADSVLQQFRLILNTWPQEASLFNTLQTKEGYRMVINQHNKLEQLKYLLQDEVAMELGVVIGFNATDGD